MTMGSDFQFENAHENFKNLDKLIKYVNMAVSDRRSPCGLTQRVFVISYQSIHSVIATLFVK